MVYTVLRCIGRWQRNLFGIEVGGSGISSFFCVLLVLVTCKLVLLLVFNLVGDLLDNLVDNLVDNLFGRACSDLDYMEKLDSLCALS